MLASGFSFHAPTGSRPARPAPRRQSVRAVSPVPPKEREATGGHGGPLTVRQRFLIGKRVDVNRAGFRELSGLPGLSDRVAKAIVEEREKRGGFRRPEDLLSVRGIKEKRLKKILPFLCDFPNN